ncbi:methyltransferase domain-containing protein [Paenimyroides tangerinum]|uniref:Methyltransferase domain-containing protein n=1 Tax=Paenimyroides tangerinum TaxID=2488728 RepID=A0A3P3W716_9FLAO|nr:methyltransferase domain-containing protein [Paenimyroides tangerinum]RRJ88463.1 methyltransferase domain-containing protein [Paenimyroides tangerinum]
MNQTLNKEYWKKRYQENEIGWDAGSVTTPIKEFIDQLNDTNVKILIPGAGNAYEAEYLWKCGFKNIFVIDIVEEPLQNLKSRIPDFPDEQLILGDFFELKDSYDLILEQTFFCALNPNLREAYVKQMFSLLKPNGKLAGVLFDFPLTKQEPPFGGDYQMYLSLFNPIFAIKKFEACYNSIKPRAGKEFFILLEKL